jgi:hypothetical protein
MDSKNPSGVNIQSIEKGLTTIIDYLTGYKLKDLLDTEDADWLKTHRTIIKSKGLIMPIITDSSYELHPEIEEIKRGLSLIDNRITWYLLK